MKIPPHKRNLVSKVPIKISKNVWIEENSRYFKRAILISTERNIGVSGNLNNAISQCQGDWIKVLSGDDKFMPFTIEKYVEYAQNHVEADIIFGKLKFYGSETNLINEVSNFYEHKLYPKIHLNNKEQYKENLKEFFVPAPGIFYKKALWNEIGGFNERYPFCEEDPFMFKVFKSNRKVFFLEEEVYAYHVRSNSLGRSKPTEIIRPIADRIRFFRDFRRKEMIKDGLFFHALDETLRYKILESLCSGKYWQNKLYRILRLFSPLRYIK